MSEVASKFNQATINSMSAAIGQLESDLANPYASPATIDADVAVYYNFQVQFRGYAQLAEDVANNIGFDGNVANANIENFYGSTNFSSFQAHVAASLAMQDWSVVQASDYQVPTIAQDADEHVQVFSDLGIPITYWSGAAFAADNVNWIGPSATAAELQGDQTQYFAGFTTSQSALSQIDLALSVGESVLDLPFDPTSRSQFTVDMGIFGDLIGQEISNTTQSISQSLTSAGFTSSLSGATQYISIDYTELQGYLAGLGSYVPSSGIAQTLLLGLSNTSNLVSDTVTEDGEKSQNTVYNSDGSTTTTSYDGAGGTGSVTEVDQENADDTSEITTYNPDDSATSVNTDYTGPDGTGTVTQVTTLDTLSSFASGNLGEGQTPVSGLFADETGDLFGSTPDGGAIYEITNTGSGYGAAQILASFAQADDEPGVLIADAAGDLFATTYSGGSYNSGTVFEIPKSGSGYGPIQTLVSFGENAIGNLPGPNLLIDGVGDLFGITLTGGEYFYGTVFEIPKSGSSYGAVKSLAYFDNATNGGLPTGLIADAAGDLIGTTQWGGANGGTVGDGTLFEIPKSGSGYGAVQTLLSFGNSNAEPESLMADAAGDLFGTTAYGGANLDGTIFEIPKTGSGYGPVETLFSFTDTSGPGPYSSLIVDAAGNLYGTTSVGGVNDQGAVFKIASGSSVVQTLASFAGTSGSSPDGLAADAAGDLFGTTSGDVSGGSVFKIDGSGFEIAPTISGTVAGQTTVSEAVVKPFSGVTIGDGNAGATDTLIITLSGAGGTLSGTGLAGTNGTYTLTGSAAAITTELDGLSFKPAAGSPGTTSTTGFTLSDTNNAGAKSLADSTTTVIDTDPAPSPTLVTLVSFTGTNGAQPEGALIADATGDLFGTTYVGGANGGGTVFEIVKSDSGYGAVQTLASFSGTNGYLAQGSLITDAAGDLFGTTYHGGTKNGGGTVFEIVKNGSGYGGVQTLASFALSNSSEPVGGLIADGAGDLFGTTSGGQNGGGIVFEIAKSDSGYGAVQTLASFTGANGSSPQDSLLIDAAGDLFGTTYQGGANGDGTVFEIAKSGTGYGAAQVLVSFNGTNGSYPFASLIADAAGDLFGTTALGGTKGDGTVFEIAKSASGYGAVQTLASFTGTNGSLPEGGLLIDAAGDLFGTTNLGGTKSDGTVFEIAKSHSGYGAILTLVSFTGTNGSLLDGSLIADATGDLFGTTSLGGTNSDGTVFEITGAGFMACYCRGTSILTRTGEVSVEDLKIGDLVVTRFNGIQPIKWIGLRRLDCSLHPDPRKAWPVRVASGAFGEGRPHRDLWISPDHAVFIDDMLIPIRHLINGATIAQVPVGEVTYYHIELDRHDILLAEGLPAESYLDTGNRGIFENANEPLILYPDLATGDAHARREARSCATFAGDEARVKPVWERLAARSRQLGRPIPEAPFTEDPGVHLEIDGRTIRPVMAEKDRCWFVVPPRAGAIRIVSRSGYPTDKRPWADDRRRLGVNVSGMVWYDRQGNHHDVPVDHPALAEGWWDAERDGRLLHRWTNGDALLPLPPAAIMVEFRIAGGMTYRLGWLEPEGLPGMNPQQMCAGVARIAASRSVALSMSVS